MTNSDDALADDENFIDRHAEQEMFEGLLKRNDVARVLLVRDKGARGKSQLLRRLQYICEWKNNPPIPVARVALDQLETPAPFSLIDELAKLLNAPGFKLDLAEFKRWNHARKAEKHAEFGFAAGPIHGEADFKDARVGDQAVAGGTVIMGNRDVYVSSREWSPGNEELARERCIEAFFADLQKVAKDRTVVILLDAADSKADQALRHWVLATFSRDFGLNPERRPDGLVLVLAGRDQFPFSERDRPLIRSIRSLSEWNREHVKAFLKVHGLQDPRDELIDLIALKLKEEITLTEALLFAKAAMMPGLKGFVLGSEARGEVLQ